MIGGTSLDKKKFTEVDFVFALEGILLSSVEGKLHDVQWHWQPSSVHICLNI